MSKAKTGLLPGAPAVKAPNIVAVAQLIKYTDIQRALPLEAVAYDLLSEQKAYDWQVGSGWGGLYSGVGLIGIPSLMKDVNGTGLTTEIAIQNVVAKPGFTDFVVYIYDQNGLVDNFCEKIHEQQVEYIDVGQNLNFLSRRASRGARLSVRFSGNTMFLTVAATSYETWSVLAQSRSNDLEPCSEAMSPVMRARPHREFRLLDHLRLADRFRIVPVCRAACPAVSPRADLVPLGRRQGLDLRLNRAFHQDRPQYPKG